MRIAQVIKAKKLERGDRVLIFDRDGKPTWERVTEVLNEYGSGWLNVLLEGYGDSQDLDSKTRVVVWRG